jgi:hypothetical protein
MTTLKNTKDKLNYLNWVLLEQFSVSVTCGSLIRPVIRNLKGINNASEGGSLDVPSPMPKSVSHFLEY